MKKKRSVCFIVSADSKTGYGHLMRSISLAEEFKKKKFKVYFLSHANFNIKSINLIKKNFLFLKNKFQKKKFSEINLLKNLQNLNLKFVIIDGYKFDYYWQKRFCKYFKLNKQFKLIKIDDYIKKNLCDIFIFFNSEIILKKKEKSFFPKKCKLLIGPKYALIRDEIIKIKLKKNSKNKKNIYITAGGKNWHNFSNKILNIINSYSYFKEFKIYVKKDNHKLPKNKNIFYFKNLKHQSKILSKKPIVLGYSGYSAIERVVLGLKSVCLKLNMNQNYIHAYLIKKKLIYPVNKIQEKKKIYLSLLKCINNNTIKNSPYDILGKRRVLRELTKH